MKIRSIVLLVVGMLFAGAAAAQSFSPFTVKDIRVEGVQRTDPGTVFSYLPVKVGEVFTPEKAQQAIRALFSTGFFKDVRLEVEGDVLVISVDESPAVAQIDIAGVKEFSSDAIRKVLRDQGLSEGRIFDRSVLEQSEQELKRQYLSRGKYGTTVQTTVTPLERNRVGINISVDEGEVAKIRSINIVGARAFREEDLLGLLVLRTPGWMTWYTKHDRYSRERLAADIEVLRSFYLNRGYLDFNIDSTQVSITPDKLGIYITVNVSEGEKYTVSEVSLSGQLSAPREELEKLIRIRPGDVFSREKLTETTKAITDRLGNDGYAFANANAVPKVDKDEKRVAFTILLDPGRRVYVRRISLAGNVRTRDEVVRREMRQLEGAFYDSAKIQLSRRRIDRTQYFDDVTIDTQPVQGVSDQVDVNFTVKEKPTGAVLLGAGLSSAEGIVASGSVSQSNIFGSGKYISGSFSNGKVNRTYALSYTDPYYTIDGLSRGFDIYQRRTNASSLSVGAYATDSLGGGVRYGYPISETDSVSFGLAAESVKLETFATSPAQYIAFVNQFGNNYRYAYGTAGWGRETRDSAIFTTSGNLIRTSAEIAGGTISYLRLGYQMQYFQPLSRIVTLALSTDVGIAKGLAGKPVPFFKGYYAGGTGSVRGYRTSSLGPQGADGNALGGDRKLVGSAELLFPVPGALQDRSLRLSTFVDAGQVYAAGQRLTPSELRYSAGVALSWNSPMGPLKISFAAPLNAQTGDHPQRLQFTFGSGF